MTSCPAHSPNACQTARPLKLIVGVPRSGTSVLHALLCTDPRTNVYIGEASYLRLMLDIYPKGLKVFDQHTGYAFADREAFRSFHGKLVAQVIETYAARLGNPRILVLKDPLLAQYLREVRVLIDWADVIAILRHPADVIASWLTAREKQGLARDIEEPIAKHNQFLNHLLRHWDPAYCRLVTYDMLGEPSLAQVKAVTGLDQINPDTLWKRAEKTYPPGNSSLTTELHGAALQVNTDTRNSLSDSEFEAVRARCLKPCENLLLKARLPINDYWRS